MKDSKIYRINGFEQIKAFYSWVFNNPDKIRPTHISLYLFLINQANRSNWAEWFKCPYDLAMQGACIGNNGTYYKCLDDLQKWGLIEYKKGINNYKAPLINLICLYDNEQLSEQVTVPLSEQVTEQQYVQLTEQLPVHIYKLLTNNIKLITDNLERVIVFLSEQKKENLYFITFWDQYHLITGLSKTDKEATEKYWKKLKSDEQQKAIDNIKLYYDSLNDKKYCKKARTYLADKNFNDEFKNSIKAEIPITDPRRISDSNEWRRVTTD